LKLPIQKPQNRKALCEKHLVEENKQLKYDLPSRVLTTEHVIHKSDSLYVEPNSVGENETTDSSDLINLNSDHRMQLVLSSDVVSNNSFDTTVHSLVKNKGEMKDGTTFLAASDSLESVCSNGMEVVYCEIPDISYRSQGDTRCRSKERQLLGPTSCTQAATGGFVISESETERQTDREQV